MVTVQICEDLDMEKIAEPGAGCAEGPPADAAPPR